MCAAVAWFRLPREIRGEAGRGITVNLSSSQSKGIIGVLKSFLCKDTRIETSIHTGFVGVGYLIIVAYRIKFHTG